MTLLQSDRLMKFLPSLRLALYSEAMSTSQPVRAPRPPLAHESHAGVECMGWSAIYGNTHRRTQLHSHTRHRLTHNPLLCISCVRHLRWAAQSCRTGTKISRLCPARRSSIPSSRRSSNRCGSTQRPKRSSSASPSTREVAPNTRRGGRRMACCFPPAHPCVYILPCTPDRRTRARGVRPKVLV